MREFMKQLVVGKQGSISSLERDLLSVAYKHSVGAHRNAHRTLQAISSKKDKYDDEDKAAIDEYRKKIQKQVESVCMDLQVCGLV
jgi:14-3-3 protein epsilon